MKRLSIALFLCLFFSCRLITEPQELTIIQEITELAWIMGNNDDSNRRIVWYLPDHADYPEVMYLTKIPCEKITLYLLDDFFVYQNDNDNICHRYPIQGSNWQWKKL